MNVVTFQQRQKGVFWSSVAFDPVTNYGLCLHTRQLPRKEILMKITLSAHKTKELLSSFNECIGFRQVDVEDGELLTAIVRYASGQSKTIALEDAIEIEFFSMYNALRGMLDIVLEHGVDARIYAYHSVSNDYREYIIDTNTRLAKADELLETLTQTAQGCVIDAEAVRDDIQGRLNKLIVNCEPILDPDEQGHDRLYTGGTYSPIKNEIQIYRGAVHLAVDSRFYAGNLTRAEISAVSKEAISALTAHSFLHELAHLCERCLPELDIGRGATARARSDSVSMWAANASQVTGVPESVLIAMLMGGLPNLPLDGASVRDGLTELTEHGRSIFGHCARFKLTLLYLASADTERSFIRPEFLPQIKKEILDSQLLVRDLAGDLSANMKLTKAAAMDQAYGWEHGIYKEYREAIASGDLIFRPKSKVFDTSDVSITLSKRKKSLYHNNPLEYMTDYTEPLDDLYYTVGGCANLLTVPHKGDAFELIASALGGITLIPSGSIPIIAQEPFLGITIENGVAQYVYSDFGEKFTKVTVEEAWWLLSL